MTEQLLSFRTWENEFV